ncbi:hypothetical protein SERLADRAFT_398647 [Serpula lacrymans var. lacrymans S7.9]|nr:uncharacterized protein SERLADRAFT_398647 [Serpula lacrymans var. lacrymans S7.9]EGO21187.1 hypothetical protein SERLADRAFT_398647 [Serpula lacrymans var. lacrymans S7.9]
MARMPSLSRNETTVKYSFIPSLPDELSISTGERVTVSGRYDDGWALCINGRGEQGMVPQECLEDTDKAQGPIDPPQYQDVGDWRNAKRKSSLAPAGDRMF